MNCHKQCDREIEGIDGEFKISQAGPSHNPIKSSKKAQKRGFPHSVSWLKTHVPEFQSSARLKKWLKVKSESRLIQEGRRQQLITTMDPLSKDSYSTNKADRESTTLNRARKNSTFTSDKSQTFTSRLCNDNNFLWLALQGDPQT